eukprot:CAMPEP_0118631892 /NCGR_PEP_ID=MMETSP0785-20121206/147_1 /TAXON_ID=91992 /ORGANISM="Bolidomonas pacifica, Strain CCMP 1866" /LENGTH=67 /DNA_ID=CAMNT_0006522613 /DNA_START=220 /DNA_END=419 /DNA_ORIENTATION=-
MKVAFGRTSHSPATQRRPIDPRKVFEEKEVEGLIKGRPAVKIAKVPLKKEEKVEVSELVSLCVSPAS